NENAVLSATSVKSRRPWQRSPNHARQAEMAGYCETGGRSCFPTACWEGPGLCNAESGPAKDRLRASLGQPDKAVVLEGQEISILERNLHLALPLTPTTEPGKRCTPIKHQGALRFRRATCLQALQQDRLHRALRVALSQIRFGVYFAGTR